MLIEVAAPVLKASGIAGARTRFPKTLSVLV
jgi:hypothetical protein